MASKLAGMDYFSAAQYLESKTLLANYLLSSQGDRMAMAHSIEGRFPFLDHRLVEFACTIPVSLRMKVLNEKNILKKAMGVDCQRRYLQGKNSLTWHPIYSAFPERPDKSALNVYVEAVPGRCRAVSGRNRSCSSLKNAAGTSDRDFVKTWRL